MSFSIFNYSMLQCVIAINYFTIFLKPLPSTSLHSTQVNHNKFQAALSDGLKAAAEMSLDVANMTSPFPYPTTIVPNPTHPSFKTEDHSDQIK